MQNGVVGIRKVIIPIVLGLAALAVAGAVHLRSLDFDRYKDGLVHELRGATGRDIAIDGPVSLIYGLEPAFVVQGVRIGNAPWGSRADMAQIDRVAARIDLAALLRGRLRFDRLQMTQADVWLETDPHGKVNWVLAGDPATLGNDRKRGLLDMLTVGGVDVEGGRVTIRDGESGDVHVFAVTTARTVGDGGSAPITLHLDGRWNGVPVALDGAAGPVGAGTAADETVYPVEVSVGAGALRLSAKGHIEQSPRGPGVIARISAAKGDKSPADAAPFSVQGDLAYRGDRAMLSNLRIAAGDSELGGTATVDLSGEVAVFDADLTADRMNAHAIWEVVRDGIGSDLASLGLSRGVLAGVNGRIGLEVRALSVGPADLHDVVTTLDLKDKLLSSERVSARFADSTVTGSFELDLRAPVPAAVVSVKAPGFNAGPLLQRVESVETFDGRVAVSARFSAKGGAAADWVEGLKGEVLLAMGPGRLRIAAPDHGRFDIQSGGPALLAGMLVARPGGDTRIHCAASRIILQDGLAQSAGTEIRSDAAHVRGAGNIDFREGRYALRFVPKSQGPELMVPTPVSIGGRLANPTLSPDPVAKGRRLSLGSGVSPLRRWFDGVMRKSPANACLKAIPRSPERRRTVERKPRPPAKPGRFTRPIIAENPAAPARTNTPEVIEEPAAAE